MRQYAQEQFSEALEVPDADRSRLGPLLVLTVGEIEILEMLAAQGYIVQDVLRDFIDYLQKDPKSYLANFRSFTYERQYQRRLSDLSMVEKVYHRSFEAIGVELERRSALATAADAPPLAASQGGTDELPDGGANAQ